jgi:hypothetical protein
MIYSASRVHPFCNLQSRVRTHAVLVIGLYELLGNPTTLLIEPPEPSVASDLLVTILSIYVIFETNRNETALYKFTRNEIKQ